MAGANAALGHVAIGTFFVVVGLAVMAFCASNPDRFVRAFWMFLFTTMAPGLTMLGFGLARLRRTLSPAADEREEAASGRQWALSPGRTSELLGAPASVVEGTTNLFDAVSNARHGSEVEDSLPEPVPLRRRANSRDTA